MTGHAPAGPARSLRVRVWEFHQALDRVERRARVEAQRRRWEHVEPVACPVDGTRLLPGQACRTCAALGIYREGRA